jgi:hypothetical protein
VAISLSGMRMVGSTDLAYYKTDPVTFFIARHCLAVRDWVLALCTGIMYLEGVCCGCFGVLCWNLLRTLTT